MKRDRSVSPSSSPRPHTKPRLTGPNSLPINPFRRYSRSTPTSRVSTSYQQPNVSLTSNIEDSYQDILCDEYSAPARLESFEEEIPIQEINLDLPEVDRAHHTDDLPALTFSPTPTSPFPTIDQEYIFVDKYSLRPLLGWTTYKRFTHSGLFEDHLVGISESNIQISNLIPDCIGGMERMKNDIWSSFRRCGKIISLYVVREHEQKYRYTVEVGFEDSESALRALRIEYGYFHNFAYCSARVSRRAYNNALWCQVRSTELPFLQTKLLQSDRRAIRLPALLEAEYGDQFPTNYSLPMAYFDHDGYRSFSNLNHHYRPTPPLLQMDNYLQEYRNDNIASEESMRSVSPDKFPFKLIDAKRAEIIRRIKIEKSRVREHVHPDLVSLENHNWAQNDDISYDYEYDGGMDETGGYGSRDGQEGDWEGLLLDP